jgi:DNA processing protein
MSQIDRFVLHLSLIPGVGIETIKQILLLVDQYSTADIYSFSLEDFVKYLFFSEKKAAAIVKGLRDIALLEREEQEIEKEKAQYISFFHPDYPENLKHIAVPPPILYYKGAPLAHYQQKPLIAMVGSRQANHYAAQVVNSFVPDFVRNNVVIVSGGAIGVDTFSHKAALQAGGDTIVVLGSGLSHFYPYQNKALFESILEKQGTIISEFPMQSKPEAHHFPQRNRIISGISSGVVIVQAAAKSGAYITAQCALEQGKDVFAVPGSIFDPFSAGCHALLQEGAQLASSSEMILSTCFSVSHKTVSHKTMIMYQKERSDHTSYSTIAKRILSLCQKPAYLDEIIEQCDDIDYAILQKELSLLQIHGYLEQELTGAFYKTGK